MTRSATAADVPAIVEIEQASFGASAWSTNLVSNEVASERHIVLLSDDGQAYGAVSMAGEDCDLDRIAVMPQARGRGLARVVLEELMDHARDLGAGRMLLEVAADNVAAIGLYESFGFDTISTRRGYYPGGVDAMVMEIMLPEWR